MTLLRDSVAVLGRMRWLVLALMIALPLDSALQVAGTESLRPARHSEGWNPTTLSVASVLASGARSSAGLYHDMGLGTATLLSALFVIIRLKWVRCWLRANAQLGNKTLLALWTILICAATTLLWPFLMRWLLGIPALRSAGLIFTSMAFAILAIWFGACVAAFWQVTLYPVILRAWNGRQTAWRDLNQEPAAMWNSLRAFNFVVFVITSVLAAAVTFLLGKYRFSPDLIIVNPMINAFVLFALVLVPFGVVVRKLSIAQAVPWGIRSMIGRFEFLLALFVPLTLAFAVLKLGESWLGSFTAMPQLIRICMQPLRGLLAALGLVVGAQYFNRNTAGEPSGTPSVNNPGTCS